MRILKGVSCQYDLDFWKAHRTHFIIVSHREMDAVLRYLKEQCGVKHIGTVGFCWGGAATHYIALQYPEVKAGVSVYGGFQIS